MLPPTYLHVLAFPVTVALMTERAFPFPLVGLVHVANSITVPVPSARTRRCRSTCARPICARTRPGGSSTCSSTRRSTARRCGPAARPTCVAAAASGEKGARAETATPTGATSLVRVPDDIGRRYGAVSGDRNPIHLHSLTAKAFGFPSAIAHGMWLKARTLAALEGRLPDAFTVDVAFKTPVFLPATIAITAAATDGGWDLDVRNPRNGKPHLAGSVSRLKSLTSRPAMKVSPMTHRDPSLRRADARTALPTPGRRSASASLAATVRSERATLAASTWSCAARPGRRPATRELAVEVVDRAGDSAEVERPGGPTLGDLRTIRVRPRR